MTESKRIQARIAEIEAELPGAHWGPSPDGTPAIEFRLAVSNEAIRTEYRALAAELRAMALDVWLKFEEPDDEEPYLEGNTFKNEDGSYRADWYHVSVGEVSSESFPTYEAAEAWWEKNGFQDFTSEDLTHLR